ncbi:MAG TPA: nickel pincer cofactor biosynthesis protein LarC, partial [Candidatus Acidoferrum sp.]|nr:nickel pincer cofactor biosynthesis protein LarC [Candidatus Acidoferrum sp.]
MGKIVYFDCPSGASGDMILGALVDAGVGVEALRAELAKLRVPGWTLNAREVRRGAFRATKVDVEIDRDTPREQRRLRDIGAILAGSGLAPAIVATAARIFTRLAEAEARVHGTTVDEVHFHEVGAVDAIVDIVGGVIGLCWLRATRIVASPLNVGTGTVAMQHGVFPVPPPATARLVQGVPVYGAGEGELLTPTGALMVTAHASSYGPLPPLKLEAVGHGAGTRDPHGRPNVLRVFVGDEERVPAGAQRVLVLEAEVDDMSPQLCGPLIERLLSAGALDAYLTPVQMKKGR